MRDSSSRTTRVLSSPDGKLLASAYLGPPTVLSEIDGSGRYFLRMAFSPDSSCIFACSILPEFRERRARLLLGMDDLDYSDGPEDGRSFMTHVFELPSGQHILEGKSHERFNGMELSVNKKELVHKWSDNSSGVMTCKLQSIAAVSPLTRMSIRAQFWMLLRRVLVNPALSRCAMTGYIIKALRSCYYHGTMSTILWRFTRILLLLEMSLVVLQS
jgi:hypothetical protein